MTKSSQQTFYIFLVLQDKGMSYFMCIFAAIDNKLKSKNSKYLLATE